MRHLGVPLALLLLLGGASDARAASDQQFDTITLDQLGGFVELGFRSRREERSSGGAGPDSDEVRFQELLHLDAAGHVYHPGLLKYRVSGDLFLFQELTDGQSDTLDGGGWNLLFFDDHRFNLTYYGEVREDEVERSFFRSSRSDSSLHGLVAHLDTGLLPLELSWSRRESARSDIGAGYDQVSEDLAARSRYELGSWSMGDLEYRLTDEEVDGRDISRRHFSATNTSWLDRERRKRLLTDLQYREQDDGRERTTLSSFGDLSWRHSDRLSTEYRLDFRRSESELQDSDQWNVEATLRHQLYESLTSTVDGYTRLHDGSFGSIETFGLRLSEDYTKQLGGGRRLDIDLVPFVELIRNRPDQETALTLGELRVLVATNPVDLGQPNIDPTSIVVTDSAGLITYVEGIDYLLTFVGETTELERLPAGSIADGDSVLVDYVYRLTGPSDLLSRGVSLYVGVSFDDWMVLYSKLRYRSEKLLSGDPNRELESRGSELIGARLIRAFMSATTELERDHSTSRTFHALTQSFSFSTPGRSWWRGSLNTTARFQKFDGVSGLLSQLTTGLLIRADVSRRSLLTLAADYRREDWTGDEADGYRDFDGFGAKATWTWYVGASRLSVEASTARINRTGQEEELDRLFVTLRREF